MSDTIRARYYTSSQAALLQQRPSELIEAAENLAVALDEAHSRPVHMLYHYGSSSRSGCVNIVDVGGSANGLLTVLTAATKVLLVGTAWPTTSPEQVAAAERYQTENSWTRWTGHAKEALRKAASPVPRQTTAAARWRVERLSLLQAVFGFTIQDLAAVLGITRPQLYKWLDAANDINLQESSRTRLATVERIAKEWATRSSAPLSAVAKEALAAGGSVFALLSADVSNDGAVIAAFDELIDKLREKPKSRSQRLRAAGLTRRPSARSLPSDD